jgi:hypothetical protein
VEKIKTHIYVQKLFFSKNCAVYENVEKYCRPGHATDDNIIRCMRIACWVPKATNTHSEYVIHLAFPLQQWLQCASVLHYTYIVCPVKSFSSFTPLLTQNLCSIVILEEPCWTVWGSNPVRGKKLYSSEISRRVRGPTQHPFTLVLGFLPGGKVAGS